MNRNEYLATLRKALAGLPDDELANALRYYEEYLDDAGKDGAAAAIAHLGTPESVAQQILADYRELSVPKQGTNEDANKNSGTYNNTQTTQPKQDRSLLSIIGIICLCLLLSPLIITVLSTLFAGICTLVGIVLAVVLVLAAIPLALLISGAVFIGFAIVTLPHVASALATGGLGLILLALGGMVAVLIIKLCVVFVPATFRAIVNLLRWILNKIGGLFHRKGGDIQ